MSFGYFGVIQNFLILYIVEIERTYKNDKWNL